MGREMKKLIKCQLHAFYLKYYISFQLIWFIIPISTIIHDIHGHMIGEGFSLNVEFRPLGNPFRLPFIALFRQITTFIKVCDAFVFGVQTPLK